MTALERVERCIALNAQRPALSGSIDGSTVHTGFDIGWGVFGDAALPVSTDTLRLRLEQGERCIIILHSQLRPLALLLCELAGVEVRGEG
jgi:hypothetical protein